MGSRLTEHLTVRLAADLDAVFPELVTAEVDVVYSALFRAGGRGADAEDVAQETFVRAYSALKDYSSARIRELKLRSWLLTIAMNLWRNELRRRSRHPVVHDQLRDDEAATADGPEELALQQETSADLGVLVKSLPEIYRTAVVLRHVVGLPLTEVAEVLDRPTGTVKAQVSRGLAMLRSSLEARQLEEAR